MPQPTAGKKPPLAPNKAPVAAAKPVHTPPAVAPVEAKAEPKPEDQKVVLRPPQQVQVQPARKSDLPEFLQQRYGDRAGTEDVEKGDVTLPRLSLCQALSPQRKKSNPAYIEGLEEGMYFNTVSSEIYGSWVTVVPLFFTKSRIKFHPMEDGGGIDCQALNGKTGGHYCPEDCTRCQFSQWADEEKPACTLFHNFVCLVVGSELIPDLEPAIAIFSLKASGLKVSKQWNAKVRMLNLPMYATAYKITAQLAHSGENEWHLPVINRTREAAVIDQATGFVNAEFFQSAEAYFQSLREKSIQVDTMGLDEEEAAERAGIVNEGTEATSF